MEPNFKYILWKQFGAAIDMLGNAIKLCPEEYLKNGSRQFYISYHSILFLDYYLTIPPTNFKAQLSYAIKSPEEMPSEAIDDIIPDRIYSKVELLDYLQSAREKCRELIAGLTDDKLYDRWINEPDELAAHITLKYTVLEILLYNLRHVQHHAAQLNLFLRKETGQAPDWVSQVEDDIPKMT